MKLNTNEKSLTVINENSIYYKIKNFFRKIFKKQNEISTNFEDNKSLELNDKKKEFNASLKTNIDTSLIDLQTQLKQGNIRIDDLTSEEVDKLIKLYKEQIEVKKKRLNEIKFKIINIKRQYQNSD